LRLVSSALLVAVAVLLVLGPVRAEVIEQQAYPEYDVTFQLKGTGIVKVILADEHATDSGYLVKLNGGTTSILKRTHGTEAQLGKAGKLPAAGQKGLAISIKRRVGRITVLCNGLIAARALDADYGGGPISYAATGGAQVSQSRCQPIDPIFFADDFTRTGDGNQGWESISGSWKLSYRPMPDFSANGFWYKGKNPEGMAMCVTGHPFWDNYSFQAAVRPTEDSFAVGLCCYYVDQNNYLLFRWTSATAPGPEANLRQLIWMHEGKRTVLKSAPGGFTPNEYQWYRLRVNVEDDLVQALIDGLPVLTAETGSLGQGKVGLYDERSGDSYFDDVLVRSWSAVREDFNGNGLWQWRDQGKWTIQDGTVNAKRGTGEAKSFCGLAKWQDYTLNLSLLPSGSGQSGVYCNYLDDRNYYLVRSRANQCELVRVSNGQSQVVDKAAVGLPADRWSNLTVESRGPYLRVSADRIVLEDLSSGPAAGKIGLYVGPGATVAFRRVRLHFLEKAEPAERMADRFVHDEYMKSWASQESGWSNPDPQAPNLYWHKGNYYGGVRLEFAAANPANSDVSVQVAVCAVEKQLQSGYLVSISASKGEHTLALRLSRLGKAVTEAKAKVDPKAEGAQCLIERRGRFVIVSVDDRPVLRYRDATPLTGTKLAFQSPKAADKLAKVVFSGDRSYQYTFNDAPVDWVVQGGVWGVQPRYACDPRWSFFGGWSQGQAAIWHKEPLMGDVTLEFYAGIKMDFPGESYDQRFRDICASICADGKHVNSGYTVIYGGGHNTWTRLLRGDKVVAETNKYLIAGKDAGGHRKWYRVALRKCGADVSVLIDGEQALSYHDPEPLRGGQVAIWTRANGIMVARTDIDYQQLQTHQQPVEAALLPAEITEAKTTLPLTITSPTHPALGNNFEADLGQWSRRHSEPGASVGLDSSTAAQGRYSLRLTNSYPADSFAATAVSTSFDANQLPNLSFDYRIPPEAKVNLYITAGGKDYCLLLTGRKIDAFPVIGRVEVIADDQWHHAEVNLAELLRAANAPANNVEEISIADRRDDPQGLSWYGFGGSPGGSQVHFDDFFLRAAGDRQVTLEWKPAATDTAPLGYSYVFDRKPDTVPPTKDLGPTASAQFTADAPGIWYFHVRGRVNSGKWGDTFHYAVVVKG